MTLEEAEMFDVIIRDGRIVDGGGNPWFTADLGIYEGRIKAIGRLDGAAHCTVHAHGRVVCPGFIDIHSHSDIVTLVDPRSESKIMQGVTTEVIGNCGLTPAPANPLTFQHLKHHFVHPPLQWEWRGFADFLDAHERAPASVNLVPLIGHGALRIAVMGFDNRRPTNDEMEEMKKLLREGLDAGAFGLSTGLIYTPACYAETEEVVELARLLRPKDRLYATHIRGEGANLVNAVKEALQIGREGEVRVQLAHHKCCGIKSWGKVHETLELIEAAREEGMDATCDVYPYDASSTDLAICLPPWVREESPEKMLERINTPALRGRIRKEMESDEMQGFWSSPALTTGWDRIRIAAVTKEENRGIEGMSLQEIAEARKADVFDVCFDLLTKEGGRYPASISR
jgi:N-acyl-D-amino-acid deacylase